MGQKWYGNELPLFNLFGLEPIIRSMDNTSLSIIYARSEQLPFQACVTAFLWTSLFLDSFQGNFYREKSLPCRRAHSKYKISKRKTKRNKRHKISFLSLQVLLTGLLNLKDIQNSRQNRSKNKLVHEKRRDTSAWKLLAPGYGLLVWFELAEFK